MRSSSRTPVTCAALAALTALAVLAPDPARAGVFGSLANFDAVNDTGRDAYGFEIEIDDPSFDHSRIASVFGLNRDFGGTLGTLGVVRWGQAEIIDLPGVGVKVRYGGSIGAIVTPPNAPPPLSYATPGESCWPGANPGWKANPCDHFGITTIGSPAATRYSWLVIDPATGNTLIPEVLHIPAVSYLYTPPAVKPPVVPGGPPVQVPALLQPRIVAEAPPLERPEDPQRWGEAFWVKSIKTAIRNDHPIDLGDLLRGRRGNPELEVPEVEIDWEIFQRAPRAHGAPGPNEVKQVEIELGEADKSIIRRYEFYKYLGPLNVDASGEADCDSVCERDPYGPRALVGAYVGQQIAGFNAVQAVPEPQTAALLLAGLLVLGWRLRRAGVAAA